MKTLSQKPPPSCLDRLPPHDCDAEAGALACVLSADNGAAAPMLAQLSRESFYDVRHRCVYSALSKLDRDGKPPDMVSLSQRLRDNGEVEKAGGLEYLMALPDKTPSAANFPAFLEATEAYKVRRAVIRDAVELQTLALDSANPPAALAEAARRMGYAHAAGAMQSQDAIRQLKDREFNPRIEPPPLRAIFTLAGIPISTPGNLGTVTSAIKTGKSAVIGAMAAAAMPHGQEADLLGFSSSNPKSMALLWFDSEQSPDDFWHCVSRSIRRAGLDSPPPWLHAYCLTGLGHKRAWACLTEATKRAADVHGGVHSMLIDGLADLVGDVNDAAESNAFVAELHDMAIQRDCPIIGVIHFNPGSEKSRGHLGSQVERKAETNLALEKDATDITVIFSTKNRRGSIPKSRGPRFSYSEEAGMHVAVESRSSARDTERREALLALAEDAFADHPAMRYSDLISTVAKNMSVSARHAERKVGEMAKLTVIRKAFAGMYEITNQASTE
jgi:DnaB-like helicase N terminal domain/AAA domain